MYQVGFGDCFLLSFTYANRLDDGRRERHILIDFGSTRWPKDFKPRYRDTAHDIALASHGKLDVVVVTHRHKDHLGGFSDDTATATIAALNPTLIIRPWTDDPNAAANATGPSFGERSLRFQQGLATAQQFALQVTHTLVDRRGYLGELADAALEQLANQDAIDALEQLAANAPQKANYLHAGRPTGIDTLIPGVTTTALGPPTVEQWPEVTGQRENDPEEYWLRQRGLLASMLQAVDAPTPLVRVAASHADTAEPGPLRWIIERLQDQQTHSLLRIVTSLENALNNTSVILLFATGTRTLLFPGDAQIENWNYTFKSQQATALRSALYDKGIDLYKVGHHGSRNASPRSLVKRWTNHQRPFAAMMSTLPGVHGETDATAVPRKTLTDALELLGPLYRTDRLPPETLSLTVTASTRNNSAFAQVDG